MDLLKTGLLDGNPLEVQGTTYDSFPVSPLLIVPEVITPSLELNFATGKQLDSRITFSRGSSATQIGATGLVEYAPENLLTFSEEFDNSYWNKPTAGSAQAVVTANNATAPDGTVTASRVAFPLVSGSNYSLIYPGNPVTGLTLATAAHAASVWMRGVSGGETVWLAHTRDGVNYTQTAVVLSTSWQRVQLLFTPSGTTPNFLQIGVDGRAGNSAPAQQIFIWGAQLERYSTARAYIPTTSAAVYGARFTHDPVTLASLGLLIEESRTNLLLRSEEIDNASWTKNAVTVTQNAGTSPDGTTTAESVTATSTGSDVRFVIQSTTKAASAIQYAYSFWAKAVAGGRYITFSVDDGSGNGFSGGLDLSNGQTTGAIVGTGGVFTSVSSTQYPNGWWRVVLVGTSNTSTGLRVAVNLAASLTTGYPFVTLNAGDGILLWGMQHEAGAFATSYIPTTSATVTRAADVATMSGTNFSSWYRQDQGTFVVEWRQPTAAATQVQIEASDGSFNNRFSIINNSAGQHGARIIVSGIAQVSAIIGSGVVADTDYRAALAAQVGSCSGAVNGGVTPLAAPSQMPVINRLSIAQGPTGNTSNGTIARIRYYRRRLPNANLQTLTT